ncbi:MAG: trypsin-like serine protease [Myxococcales bacterium]|nr:trypsin-like serine protease [Myxococcales bacterium]
MRTKSHRMLLAGCVLWAASACSSSAEDPSFFAGVSRTGGPFADRSGTAERRATAARYPFVAIVLDEGRHHCSGTLVRPDLLVTARHCLLARDRVSVVFPSDGVFRFGVAPAAGSVVVEAKDVLSFEADAPSSSGLAENDIAYITLQEGATRAVAGPLPAISFTPLPPGRALALVGFPDYRPAPTNRIESANCSTTGKVGDQAPYGKGLIETSCAASNGDSGGGVFAFTNDGAPVLVGVVSHTFAVSPESVEVIVPTGKDAFGSYVPASMSALPRATRR